MIEDAVLVSVWDDGMCSFESPCRVDLGEMHIVALEDVSTAWNEIGRVSIDEDEIDHMFGSVSHLDEEYVELQNGTRFSVKKSDGGLVEDLYEHGFVASSE